MANPIDPYVGGHWNLGHTRAMSIINEIETSSARVTLIVGVAFVDDCLTATLIASSAVQDKRFIESCWGEYGAIRDFSLKIDLGVHCGLYGLDTRHDLRKLRDMRNLAAHKSKQWSFGSAGIKGDCRDLKLPDFQSERRAFSKLKNPRDRFVATVSLVTGFLMTTESVLKKYSGINKMSWRLP